MLKDDVLVSALVNQNKVVDKRNKYIANFKALCPNDKNIVDKYKCKIYSKKTIMVEEINEYLASFEKRAVYQEDLTDVIFNHFECEKVVLIGEHIDVKIKSISI